MKHKLSQRQKCSLSRIARSVYEGDSKPALPPSARQPLKCCVHGDAEVWYPDGVCPLCLCEARFASERSIADLLEGRLREAERRVGEAAAIDLRRVLVKLPMSDVVVDLSRLTGTDRPSIMERIAAESILKCSVRGLRRCDVAGLLQEAAKNSAPPSAKHRGGHGIRVMMKHADNLPRAVLRQNIARTTAEGRSRCVKLLRADDVRR